MGQSYRPLSRESARPWLFAYYVQLSLIGLLHIFLHDCTSSAQPPHAWSTLEAPVFRPLRSLQIISGISANFLNYLISPHLEELTIPFRAVWTPVWPVTRASKILVSDTWVVTCDMPKNFGHKVICTSVASRAVQAKGNSCLVTIGCSTEYIWWDHS